MSNETLAVDCEMCMSQMMWCVVCDYVTADSDSEDEETATKRIIQQVTCCYC